MTTTWLVLDPVALLIGVILVAWLVLYVRGWLRLRRRGARDLASVYRLVVFLTASALVAAALFSPMSQLYRSYLFMRSLQFVILCLLAAPAFHLACGYDVLLWGLPDGWRRKVRRTLQPDAPVGRAVAWATPMALAWLGFVALFLVWHEPIVANWLLDRPLLHTAALAVLGLFALLFWWQVVGAGPRLHTPLAPWVIAIMLVITEITNMVTGVSMAFAGQPIYAHYAAAAAANPQRALDAAGDQALGGATLWVAGSLLYVSSIVLVLNRLFVRYGSEGPQAAPNWDDDDNMIMPGLEHRVRR